MDPLTGKRLEIVALGHKLLRAAAHYLWGAQGDKPGNGGVALAPPVLDPDHPEKTIFCAATLNGLGLWPAASRGVLNGKRPAQKVWDLVKSDGRDEVLAFINKYKANPGVQGRLRASTSRPGC